MFEVKEMHRQKEQRLQERIDLLSKNYDCERDLNIIRDLQGALDKIRAITKPIYNQKIRDFPDFQQVKNERLEVTYTDFAVFLAKQAIQYFDKLEDVDSADEDPRIEDEEDGINRAASPSIPFSNNNPYPSVTNLLGNVSEKNHFKSGRSSSSPGFMSPHGNLPITDEDLQKAFRIQQEFQRQHQLLVREISPHRSAEKENTRINQRTVSEPNFVPCNLSQRELSRKSLHTDIRDTIHSQRNKVFEDKGQFVTLSHDHSLERAPEEDSPAKSNQFIRSLHMSAKITPRGSSNFKRKFGHLFSRKMI